jgi:hypothetical protein
MLEPAVTFASVGFSILAAHQVADHIVQTDWQAQNKGRRDTIGRIACGMHVCTYTLTTILFVGTVWLLFDLPISPAGFLLGQVVSAVTHYWADRRFTLKWLMQQWPFSRMGKHDFFQLGCPRDVRAISKAPAWGGTGTYTTSAARIVDVELVDNSGGAVKWDNPSLGTGAYALDQSWHWFWLFIAALVTALV